MLDVKIADAIRDSDPNEFKTQLDYYRTYSLNLLDNKFASQIKYILDTFESKIFFEGHGEYDYDMYDDLLGLINMRNTRFQDLIQRIQTAQDEIVYYDSILEAAEDGDILGLDMRLKGLSEILDEVPQHFKYSYFEKILKDRMLPSYIKERITTFLINQLEKGPIRRFLYEESTLENNLLREVEDLIDFNYS